MADAPAIASSRRRERSSWRRRSRSEGDEGEGEGEEEADIRAFSTLFGLLVLAPGSGCRRPVWGRSSLEVGLKSSRGILAWPPRSPLRLEPFDFEPTPLSSRNACDTSPARNGPTSDSRRLASGTTMEPPDAPRTSNRDQPLEFHARNSNPRFVAYDPHERLPLSPVRSAFSTESLVHCGMRELMTNDLLQERHRSVEEEVRDSNLSRPRNVEAEGNTHPSARHDSNSRFEARNTPCSRPRRKPAGPGRLIERRGKRHVG